MDRQGPPNRPRYQRTRFRQRKRCDDVSMSRQEGSAVPRLANVHSMTGPVGIIYRTLFLSFGGTGLTFKFEISLILQYI